MMLYNERAELILQQLQLQSTVKVTELSQLLQVSVDTVRRVLEEHPEGPQVTFVCFDARTEDLYQAQLAEL